MDNIHIKCSSKLHQNINANSYCQECRLYMCEKCQKMHLELYNHNQLNINENQNDIFTGVCNEENHINYLEFFCKTHNKLCCLACISNINKKGYGEHKDCDICIIEDIKEEKRLKFKENIKEFENLSNSINICINQLKNSFEEINKKKEEMKITIQKIFTKLRNELNNREDELLLKIDDKFNNSFVKEENLKIFEKMPNQIQKILEEIKLVDKEWDIENLNYFLNCCSNLENKISKIKKDNESLQKCVSSKIYRVDYSLKEYEQNQILEKIKTLGDVYYEFEFEKPLKDKNEEVEYILEGEKENIITKVSKQQNWIRILSKNILNEPKEYYFTIKILKTKSKNIMIGIAQTVPQILNKDFLSVFKSLQNQKNPLNKNTLRKRSLMVTILNKFDIDIILNYGWYYSISSSSLYSDFPQNYRGKSINLDNKNNEIKIKINMKDGLFDLILENNNIISLYNNIPLDKPISLSVLLFDEEDSIEIVSL